MIELHKLYADRYDCIVVWGNGMPNILNILNDIEKNKEFEICLVKKHKVNNFSKLLKTLYSRDHAPVWAIKGKVEYLKSVSNEICFIVAKNLSTEWDYFGEGRARISESVAIRKLKHDIRSKYNTCEDFLKNVIHATDNTSQTDNILQYLGYKGISIFDKKEILNTPYHIKKTNTFNIVTVPSLDIKCSLNGTNEYSDISKTPHYKFLLGDEKEYINYLKKYTGDDLEDGHSPLRFNKLKENFNYSSPNLVVCYENKGCYYGIDGMHRLALCHYNDYKKVKIYVISV